MVMSSLFGRRRRHLDNGIEEWDCARRMASALMDKFHQEYGSNICSSIHDNIFGRTFDLFHPPDREAFEKLGAHDDKCTSVVGKAAAWATELILDEMANRQMHLKELQSIQQ